MRTLLAVLVLAGCSDLKQNGEACESSDECVNLCKTEWANGVPIPGGVCTSPCQLGVCEDPSDVCMFYTETGERFCFPEITECREHWSPTPFGTCFPWVPSN